MEIEQLNPQVQRLFALLGPGFAVILLIGLFTARLLPPPDPEASAQQIAAFYAEHALAVQVGCTLMCFGFALLAPWGAATAMWLRRAEHGFPLFTYAILACIGCCTALVVTDALVWCLAAFRPNDTLPDVTRMLNDLGWFLFLATWPPFSIWCALVGYSILRERSDDPTFPRWVGYLSYWTALLMAPAMSMVFTKSGPLAYNGLFALWIPMFAFLIWTLGVTYAMLRRISRQHKTSDEELDSGLVAADA